MIDDESYRQVFHVPAGGAQFAIFGHVQAIVMLGVRELHPLTFPVDFDGAEVADVE